MNANLNPITQSRPNQFVTAGAALLVSSMLVASVIGLFASQVPAADKAVAATAVVQHKSASPAA